jgi:CRISPR/Cas system endoribonuclease Cas6 (RAMP superfamily)
MTTNKKAAPAGTGTASKPSSDTRHSTAVDPLAAWYALAKPSRDRQQKRSWKRNNKGAVDPFFGFFISLAILVFVLMVGGAR